MHRAIVLPMMNSPLDKPIACIEISPTMMIGRMNRITPIIVESLGCISHET